jgi:uncharacterized protein (TIGR02145 family)
MKAKVTLFAMLFITGISAFSQRSAMELTYTAIDNATHSQLDSIKIMNRTQGGDTVLFWPDTVLSIYFTGIPETGQPASGFKVFQNYPNPVIDHTIISLNVPEKDKVNLVVTDIVGRIILISDRVLDKGIHSFDFAPGTGSLFFFSARWRDNSSSIKILQAVPGSNRVESIEYLGCQIPTPTLKSTSEIESFTFAVGDELLYIGYSDGRQSGRIDTPETSETYTFQFATNIPCPGTPTIVYEGQVYHTIQIFSQCWLRENLNVGTMITDVQEMMNNGILEKYCQGDSPDYCANFGGLYKWWEAMQYINEQGTQGICPSGWHLPSDEEWKVLEGSVDGQFGVGDNNWDIWGPRGFEAGLNLKATQGWIQGGNGTDLYGFSGLGGGWIWGGGNTNGTGGQGNWWTSTEINSYGAWARELRFDFPWVRRNGYTDEYSFSVRCIKD